MKCRLAMVLGVLAVMAGCQKTESTTEIVLELSTNIAVPGGMDTLSLKIGPQTNPQVFAKTYPLGTSPGQIMLPRRMTLVPTDMDTVLSVLVEGLLGNRAVVSRLVNTKFIKGQSKLLRIELVQKCVGQVCPNNQTCTPGASCANPYVEPADLPTFDPTKNPQTPGLDPDAGVSMDASADHSAGDGRLDGQPGRDGARFDGQPGGERGPREDGKPGADGTPSPPDAPAVNLDGPGVVVSGPDGSVALDAPNEADGSLVVKLDTGLAVDAPIKVPDAPPALKTKGVACALPGECDSGLCVDGVCCEGLCEGLCMACNVPGQLGTCALVPLNDPSNGNCPDEGIATCGRNGKCNGQGGCMLYPSGVACSAETCPAGISTHTRAGLCDGQGHCGQGQVQDCAPFLCHPTSNTCNPTCTVATDCVAPNQCINGSCGKKGNGLPCSAPSDCQSDVCAQGVCCAGPCTDLCKSCAVDGALGTCTAVPPGKPDGQSRCVDQGATTCGTNGLCDGAGACQQYAAGLPCGAKCDAPAATFTPFACGAGTCNPNATQSCSPYSCDNNGCKKSCAVLSDCAVGFVCGAGGLCVRPPEQCMNGIDDDADGLTDCADTDCQPAFTCVPEIPDGWKGPLELFDGAAAAMPECKDDYSIESYTGWGSFSCPNITCGSCGCGTPQDVSCGNPTLGFSATTTCINTKPIELTPGQCVEIPPDTLISRFVTRAGLASGGKCTPNAGTPTLPAASWNAARACGAELKGGGGCGNGFMCVPAPRDPFLIRSCVMREGNLGCPTVGYTSKRDYFDSDQVNDTRKCSSNCTCGDPTNVRCVADLQLFGVGSRTPCNSTPEIINVPSSCAPLPFTVGSLMAVVPLKLSLKPYTGGSCAPSGSVIPSGECTPLGSPTTICCTP